MEEDKLMFIINPVAGGGKALKVWTKNIYPILEKKKISFDYLFTQKPYDGFNLAMEGIKKGYKKLVSVGGDGTVNEIVNAIMSQDIIDPIEISVGSIGSGSGNDWGKSIGIPANYEEAVSNLRKDNFILQDVGKVGYIQTSVEKTRYFVNVAGMGFDAEVTYKANKSKKRLFGKLSYSLNLLSTLISFKDLYVEIKIDGEKVYANQALTLNVGICRYSGGGMMFTPKAKYDDGLFDVTVVDKISVGTILVNLRKIYDGSFVNHEAVKTFRGKSVEITSKEKLYLETDGESLGHSPLYFEIFPQRLKVLSGLKIEH
ncbi:MAG: diacylglycerol kinase family lipid kinase [Thermotogota bacterium]|nr:diacylglycerol kinase family lipid kinase [Thermotogota bacterium]